MLMEGTIKRFKVKIGARLSRNQEKDKLQGQ